MTRAKGKEIMKVVAVSALSIGLFTTALVGANRVAHAAATDGTRTLPPIEATVVIPQNLPPEGFVAPQFNLAVEGRRIGQWPEAPSYALSMEEAALIGAEYIWEVLGESIDGKYVSMVFLEWLGRMQWHGMVVDLEAVPYTPTLYNFAIDAITGERLELFASRLPEPTDPAFRSGILSDDDMRFIDRISRKGMPEPTAAQIIEFAGLAKSFAQKHFNNSAVVEATYMSTIAAGFDRDIHGNIFAQDYLITFFVTDDTGHRVADVGIIMGTSELSSVVTRSSDLLAGLRPERPVRE